MPGAGPWHDERHRFRRGDKGPTLPPRGYAAPSPSNRGGPGTGSVGSEEAPIEGLASVRRSNGTCSFPAFRFHEWPHEI